MPVRVVREGLQRPGGLTAAQVEMRAAGRRPARRSSRLTFTPETGAAIGWCECAMLLRR
ncbi:hypothetical protein V2I01_41115 [Micromonospora sp. BRA006-A]|nr:hypothetical protein [Micromonospora sp. BRA006-A]